MNYRHISVMPNEAVAFLDCKPGKIIADCTLGGSGHSSAILEKIPGGVLIGIDQDIAAIDHAKNVLNSTSAELRLFHGNFIDLAAYLSEMNLAGVDGILMDLGLSLYQLEASGRGFSFQRDEPLDMRMNAEGDDLSAEDIVNTESEEELARIFKEYGEERYARRIAKSIVIIRKQTRICSSLRLAHIVSDVVPKKGVSRIHPATRTFMALRIAVNKELERLDAFMAQVSGLLNPGGRLCVISFHSLEDRIVKHGLKALAKTCICPSDFPICVCRQQAKMRILTPKAQKPSEAEISANSMARSAKLRAAEKI